MDTMHYATPPGWRPRTPLPALRRVHVNPDPAEGRARRAPDAAGLRVRTGVRPAPVRRPPTEGHQLATTLGMSWPVYLGIVVFGVVVGAISIWRLAQGHPMEGPLVGCSVLILLGLQGLADYARAALTAAEDAERARWEQDA